MTLPTVPDSWNLTALAAGAPPPPGMEYSEVIQTLARVIIDLRRQLATAQDVALHLRARSETPIHDHTLD